MQFFAFYKIKVKYPRIEKLCWAAESGRLNDAGIMKGLFKTYGRDFWYCGVTSGTRLKVACEKKKGLAGKVKSVLFMKESSVLL